MNTHVHSLFRRMGDLWYLLESCIYHNTFAQQKRETRPKNDMDDCIISVGDFNCFIQDREQCKTFVDGEDLTLILHGVGGKGWFILTRNNTDWLSFARLDFPAFVSSISAKFILTLLVICLKFAYFISIWSFLNVSLL